MKLNQTDIKNIRSLIKEATTAGGGQVDDGPNVFFGSRKGYKNWVNKNEKLIKFIIDKYYVNDIVDDFDPEGYPDYGNNFDRPQSVNRKIMDKYANMVGFTIYSYLVNKSEEDNVTGDYENNANETRLFKEIGFDRMFG